MMRLHLNEIGDVLIEQIISYGFRDRNGSSGQNTYLSSRPLGGSPESEVRRRFFERCSLGKHQLADPDGNWIDVTDESWT